MVQLIAPNIYRIAVGLPNSPLKVLNSYVITGGQRNLIIDTGFNRPECLEFLKNGLDEIGLDMSETDIFVTHLHADHCGLVSQIMSPESRVYMSEPDWQLFHSATTKPDTYWLPMEQLFIREGYPEEELIRSRLHHPGRKFLSEAPFDCIFIKDGDFLPYGGGQLQCVSTPGHTPGHMCLYDPERQILFTGDHLLFDISPNIATWETMPDALSYYLQSLEKVSQLPIEQALTAHRENEGDFQKRVEELQHHHAERLADIMEIVAESPGINGYEVTSRMKWSIRAASWEDFPPGQRWFAVGEAIAHLNHLVDSGDITRTVRDGIHTYTITV